MQASISSYVYVGLSNYRIYRSTQKRKETNV